MSDSYVKNTVYWVIFLSTNFSSTVKVLIWENMYHVQSIFDVMHGGVALNSGFAKKFFRKILILFICKNKLQV